MTATIRLTTGTQADPVLHIRTATEPLEISQLRAVLNEEHYLQAGRPAGHRLTNWTPLGFTKGFKRHRADFYQDLQSLKQPSPAMHSKPKTVH